MALPRPQVGRPAPVPWAASLSPRGIFGGFEVVADPKETAR